MGVQRSKWGRGSWSSSSDPYDGHEAALKPEHDGNALLPHKGRGDDYFNGDIYDGRPTEEETRWEIDSSNMPYLSHIKSLSHFYPHLRFLAQWMQVTTSPVKWQFIKSQPNLEAIRQERASRIKVAAVDFASGQGQPTIERINTRAGLTDRLDSALPSGTTRLYIVEDLSRNVIELLGSRLDIDPQFFREQINDYLWFNTRDPWVELPDLDVVARNRPFFRLQYVHSRYFKNQKIFREAQVQAGMFNVLRRLDDDSEHDSLFDEHGAIIALVRSKASLWIRPSKPGEDTVGVLLIDPSVTAGHPLWGGYRPFKTSPPPSESSKVYASPPRDSLFEDLLFWIAQMPPDDVDAVRDNPRAMAHRMVQIICAEWLTLSRYILARLGQIEWEVERPDFRPESLKGIDSSLSKSHTWRRRLPIFRNMVADAQKKLFRENYGPGASAAVKAVTDSPGGTDCISDLRDDFAIVAKGLEDLLAKMDRITAVTTAVAAFEESRRAVEQNRALGRLTYLAVIFAPLSFVSSFFSMSTDVTELSQTFWVYFCVAVPISLGVYLVVDQKWTNSLQGVWRGRKDALDWRGRLGHAREKRPKQGGGRRAGALAS
ncbi:Uu.00g101910.m01.CDS01 [Anthostomella pinea]|uniref:Uu.00g101910.m01.CDS01 n=1 Tax=Anthostomella pinea TaxID=933095 RepID=A0AAI8VE93_9PEZI|nr:Uu.00g101910.m01.CDS01 [Anthostomella pinea]